MLSPNEVVRRRKRYQPPLGGRSGLRLDFNENTAGCSPRVLARLGEITADDLTRYPEREPVERTVAEFLGVQPSGLLLTNGVDEAIHLLCETYLQSGDEALIVVPTFSMYEIYAAATGATAVTVQAGDDFSFPTATVLARITSHTRLIAIANPNNPTGSVVAAEDILAMAHAAPQAAVLIDEAYFDFYGKTMMDEVAKRPNLFLARTFSKAYGMAGLRVGVLVGPEAQMQFVHRLASPYNVNGVALACLPTALADRQCVSDYVAQVKLGRERLESELRESGIPYWPSQANFLLARFDRRREAFVQGMRQRGILVRDRHGDPGCAGCVRITVGTEKQVKLLIAAMRECLGRIPVIRELPA